MEQIPGPLIDPAAASLHILLVDANQKCRQATEVLLNGCNYQVTACKTSQEAIQVLKAQQGPEGTVNFDLIMKEHCPSSGTNASRFLRRAQTEPLLQGIPIIVISTTEDRDVMVNCLQLGAADFMLKPLRASELRNLWARVYWWRRATYHQSGAIPMNDSRSGSASEETREASNEPQEAALNEAGVGGLATATTQLERCNDSAEPSKESKDNLGWSGTKNNGDSKPTTQQGSNNPSIPSLPNMGPGLLVSASNGQSQNQKCSHIPADFPSLELNQLHKPQAHPVIKVEPRIPSSGNTCNPGFRAYVASDQHKQGLKRSLPDMSSREDPGSSGSDWTGSLEKAEQNKRQAPNGSVENGLANVTNGLAMLTQAWLQNQQNQQSFVERAESAPQTVPVRCQPVDAIAGLKGLKPGENGRQVAEQPNQTGPAGFPFCLLPGMVSPFGLQPPFWNQNAGSKAGSSMSLPMMFAPFNAPQQQKGSEQDSNAQQQQQVQQAMHNQIMYHHNLLLQQYGIPAPFLQYSAFANAAQKPATQEATKQPSLPAPVVKRHKSQGNIPNSSSQVFMSGRSSALPDNLTSSNTRYPMTSNAGQAPQRVTDSATDATKPSTTGQMGMDGYLLEPSRKQRRAEALHKYKQKRKNLNFTKKIRYESRKQLAQARPRVKGQFVRITSEDVNAVVDSLTPAQMKGVAEGTADVTELLIENAQKVVDAKAATEDPSAKPDDLKDIEISEETESGTGNGEEEDVSSPASKVFQDKPTFNTKTEALQKVQRPPDATRQNSSHSGSNSPETRSRLLQPCS